MELFAEQQLIVDVRWSTTSPGNSATACQAAVKALGISRVLLEPIVSTPDTDKCELFFCDLNVVEYHHLTHVDLSKWMEEVLYSLAIAPPDISLDLPTIQEVDEYWLYFHFEADLYERAMAELYEATQDEARFVVVAPEPLPKYRSFRRADPTGRSDYVLTDGSLTSAIRFWRDRRRTVALVPTHWTAFGTVVFS